MKYDIRDTYRIVSELMDNLNPEEELMIIDMVRGSDDVWRAEDSSIRDSYRAQPRTLLGYANCMVDFARRGLNSMESFLGKKFVGSNYNSECE